MLFFPVLISNMYLRQIATLQCVSSNFMGVAGIKDRGEHQLGKNYITFYCKVITVECSGTYLQRHPPVLLYCGVLFWVLDEIPVA